MTVGVESYSPRTAKDDETTASTATMGSKRSRPSLESAKASMKSVSQSVKDIVQKNKAARLLQRLFRQKRKKKRGKKKGKLDDIPEVEEDVGEEEDVSTEEEEEKSDQIGAAQDEKVGVVEVGNDDGLTDDDDDDDDDDRSARSDGEVDDKPLRPVHDIADQTLNRGHASPALIYTPESVRSKAEVGEINKDHIKGVKELAKFIETMDEETKKRNEMNKVKHSVAATFGNEMLGNGKDSEVKKVPLQF